ncbi:hypothetical protein OUZ56_030954 [Daphnia magna]|uniref:Uncharacterized protein n=1 Tax=Daphnia magna TaxID=35525 RepID=A0ABQ9ZSU7_9CRUS|nr:hypothetical protein OUZ56_030954 [Daphnia magna]
MMDLSAAKIMAQRVEVENSCAAGECRRKKKFGRYDMHRDQVPDGMRGVDGAASAAANRTCKE